MPGLADVHVAEDVAYVGGGSLPDQAQQTWVVEVTAAGLSDAELARRLRTGAPAVMARVRDGKVVFDLRSVFGQQEAAIIDAVSKATGPA